MGPCLRRTSGVALLLLVTRLAACANVRPLEGGAPDVTPPSLASASPADSAVALGTNPVLQLRFSETLNPSTVRTGLRTYPSIPRPEVRVKGSHVEVRYVDSLPPDTTLVVVLGRGIQDAPGRDNRLPREIWLVYATGESLRSGEVLGRITVKGKPEAAAAVQYQPLADTAADSAAPRPRGPRPRLPAAAGDAEGLFHLRGLPAGRPFRLQAFVDRNGNLEPDAEELQAAFAETLLLASGEVRRGLQWNLVDPDEPGVITGVVFNSSNVSGPLAVMLVALDLPSDAASAGTEGARGAPRPAGDMRFGAPAAPVASPEASTAAESTDATATRDSTSAPSAAAESALAAEVSADAESLRVRQLPAGLDSLAAQLPLSPRGDWEPAYAALSLPDSAGLRRTVYASPRGDYSVRVRPGRHRLVAFVDVSGDSLPGIHVSPDSSRLDWEPLWVGGVLEVAPGAEVRPRAIDIDVPR